MRTIQVMPALILLGAVCLTQAAEPSPPPSPDMIVEWLRFGNERHAEGRHVHWHQSLSRRQELATRGESPQAAIVTCSESAVPPEILFDQGLGDLYVVRVPGNVVGERELAGVEHAVEHYGVQVVVVLGHRHCSLVAQALRGSGGAGHLGAIFSSMAAPIAHVKGLAGDVLDRAIQANVETGVATLLEAEPVLAPRVHASRVRVLGAVYQPASGQVRWIAPTQSGAAMSSTARPAQGSALPH
ncbi:MAG: carbonic anhydrase [Bryobacteraceae bacterium]